MSLEALPGVSPVVREFVSSVRVYMRDYPELNRLVDGVESSDRQIAWAALDALAYFNGTPHFTRLSLEELLLGYNQDNLMRRLTAITLLESIVLLQSRNHVNYSNGGLNLGSNDGAPFLMQYIQYLRASTDQLMNRVKISINIASILGQTGVHSEYAWVNGYAGGW